MPYDVTAPMKKPPWRSFLFIVLIVLSAIETRAASLADLTAVQPELLEKLRVVLLAADPRPRIEALASLHSLRATEDYDRAAAHIESWARAAGLEVSVEDFAADGKARYGAFLSEPGWRVRQGELSLLEPEQPPLADWAAEPLALVWYSGSARVTATLEDVGSGVSDADYRDKDLVGKIVLADGPHSVVHQKAVYERGAAGVVSGWHLFPDRYPDLRSSDGYGVRPWVGADGRPAGFVFSVPRQTANALRAYLAAGKPVVLRAEVATELFPSHYRVVSARLAGDGSSQQEVLVVNHLDSTKPGAVHNAAAALALLEAGGGLARLIAEGKLARPRRAVRFLWVPEHRGTLAYLLAHPELRERVVAAVNLDMPTARHIRTGAITTFRRTPDSHPSFADDVFGELLEWVRAANTAEFGNYPESFEYPIVADSGSQESFYAQIGSFSGESDHVEFLAAGIPMGFFGCWPFDFLGTTADTVELFDATQLKRVALILAAGSYAIAGAARAEVEQLGRLFTNRAEQRILARAVALEARIARLPPDSDDTDLFPEYRDAVAALRWELDRELRAAGTLARLHDDDGGPGSDPIDARLRDAAGRARDGLERLYRERARAGEFSPRQIHPEAEERRLSRWIVERTPETVGPVPRAYLEERLGRALTPAEAAVLNRHRYADFEILNFVSGKRSVLDIQQAVSAEFGSIPLAEVESYLQALERAGLVRIRRSP